MSSPRRSERRHHSQRQYRQGGQSRHGTERQESRAENGREDRHLYDENQTKTARVREQEPDLKKDIEGEHERPDELKIRTGPRTEPITDSRSEVQDTDKHRTSPPMQDRPRVHPILIKGKKAHLSLPLGDESNYDYQERWENIPDNLSLQTDISVVTETSMTGVQSQKNRNKSKINENTEVPLTTTYATNTSEFRSKAVRTCILLPNGTVMWKEPDTSMCREKEMQAAEKDAQEVVSLTNSPSTVTSSMFTDAADRLAKIVEHAIKDRAVSDMFYLS